MLLQISMLVKGMLYSTQALGYISEKHINQLEECDKIFMRLFELEQGKPVEGCFLETSVWPLRYIIMGRQLSFTGQS